jgi:hypothetical protein
VCVRVCAVVGQWDLQHFLLDFDELVLLEDEPLAHLNLQLQLHVLQL